EKRVFLVILFTSFSGSLVSRIPGAVHKAFHAVIQLRLKEKLSELADEDGITQAQMLEWLIESEVKRRKSL
ncbi:RepB family protein, partial [Escherichia coli]|uniref:RepB family protein n=1 Tax=Escherichia coli TaxID=562 RepID=UPI0029F56B0F